MAMLPFCGYNMGDYFGHWLDVGKKLAHPPKIFRTNWFRTGDTGKFLWPGFGDNLRVLKWVLERCEGNGGAVETPIGWVPSKDALDRRGVDLTDDAMVQLLKVDSAEWAEAVAGQEDFLHSFGERLPKGIADEHNEVARRIHDDMTHPDLHGRDSGT
jgi:phosphoenolpyruvate carboxykinase (GTP)